MVWTKCHHKCVQGLSIQLDGFLVPSLSMTEFSHVDDCDTDILMFGTIFLHIDLLCLFAHVHCSIVVTSTLVDTGLIGVYSCQKWVLCPQQFLCFLVQLECFVVLAKILIIKQSKVIADRCYLRIFVSGHTEKRLFILFVAFQCFVILFHPLIGNTQLIVCISWYFILFMWPGFANLQKPFTCLNRQFIFTKTVAKQVNQAGQATLVITGVHQSRQILAVHFFSTSNHFQVGNSLCQPSSCSVKVRTKELVVVVRVKLLRQ
mmetsp:Transcript_10901/g.26365  ORF Transcript_10901/g.26365 Transcript_10901/m.26365 type:complete len:261 (-) Transcript_10901:898-1680(-)